MKVFARILSLVVLASAITLFMNCGGSDPKPDSKEKTQFNKLKGTWEVSSVTLDDVDRTDFDGVSMTISGSYTQDGGSYPYSFSGTMPNPSPWPKTGDSFKFGANPETQLVRLADDPDLGLNYVLTNSDNTLTISFTYNGAGFTGGRTEEVNGDWEFVFTKQ